MSTLAKYVSVEEPTEKTYVIELTQSELDFMVGVMTDLSEDYRDVQMLYPMDGDTVRPSDLGRKKATDIAVALSGNDAHDYEYFDYWETVSEGQE